MIRTTAIIVTLLAAGVAHAAPALTNVEVGVFCALPEGAREPAPDTIIGYIERPEGAAEFRWRQTQVPAAIGISFGFKATAAEEGFNATIRVTHPPFDGYEQTVESWDSNYASGGVTGSYFTFDAPFEQQPGFWKFEVISESGKVLLSQRFLVVPETKLRHIVDACGTQPAIS